MVSPSKSFFHSMRNARLRRATLQPLLIAATLVIVVVVGAVVWVQRSDHVQAPILTDPKLSSSSTSSVEQHSYTNIDPSLPLPSRMTSNLRVMSTTSSRQSDTKAWPSTSQLQHTIYSPNEQLAIIQQFGSKCLPSSTKSSKNIVLERYGMLLPRFQSKLFQYCMLYQGYGNVYLDTDNIAFLQDAESLLLNSGGKNIGIQASISSKGWMYVHEALLYVPTQQSKVMLQMVQLLLETSNNDLQNDPDLIERSLGSLIVGEESSWVLWQSHCPAVQNGEDHLPTASCPMLHGYCCHVTLNHSQDESNEPLLALRHPIRAPTSSSNEQQQPDSAFYATVTEQVLVDDTTPRPTRAETPNFFDILFRNDCLPTSKECHRCLKLNNHCRHCVNECPCYCKALCRIRPPPKLVVSQFVVRPPVYRKDPSRLIPRLIHQTWYEPVTPDKYPNMSRLMESWKQSGWEYTFYDDNAAAEFLSQHFPSQVRQAYDSIIPGAFKADLFRYCVLLIKGGIYADMDVLLESNLDLAVSSDIGFMTPQDEPGTNFGARSCLWNGLLAVAPGHPFLAKTIELVVNNIRNRFTSVDYDDMLCPNPQLSVSHSVDTLFTCGPCILGAGINTVLRRHKQSEFEVGDVDIWKSTKTSTESELWAQEVVSGRELQERDTTAPAYIQDPRHLIPGRTIILQQNKQDMGAHRFTHSDRSLIIAATDMPDYDDRPPTVEHYSKSHEKFGVYGLKRLYTDAEDRANEYIRVIVEQA